MAICITAGAVTTVLAAAAFTLSWTHSVEKVRWEEDWVARGPALQVVEARIRGSGAGMEPPEGSRLEDGWWVYRPVVPAQEQLLLAASGATGSGWRLCASGRCLDIAEVAMAPVSVRVCRPNGPATD